ncbi:drebrin-like protein B isoform X2 [Haliotis rufescens]|uniref:drebrin-like protein B isoform X2 n=1 Tax=Haliotis rufescens TaxID=6454 RepID=UPI00201F1DC8|nr:drebrin-like protein B isoform X2 [Haliotis rufescens]
MAIDLKKNKDSLQKAYNDVVNDKSDTAWAVFGYEGNSPVLKVYETGEGGVEEMTEELNSGKIMYGYCRVTDPNTDLPKYVLINWQGEGAPDALKLKCTQHLRDMTNFLKTIHVTVNARTEADVDEDDVIKKVSKSSGANYSFHKEKAKPIEAPTPVGSVYKKTMAAKDIKTSSRDKFWAKTEVEEKQRQEEEKNKKLAEQQDLDKARKERELKEAKERDQRMQEKMKGVHEQKRAEKEAAQVDRENEKNKWEKEQQESYKDDERKRKRSESLRKERAQEAAALSSSSGSARDFFKQKSVERPDDGPRRGPPPPRKIRQGFLSAGDQGDEEPQGKQPIKLPTGEPSSPPQSSPPSKPVRKSDPEPEPVYQPDPEPEPVYQPDPEPEPVYQPDPEPEPEPEQEPEPEPEPEPAPQLPQTRNLLQQHLPPRQESDEEQEEQNWDEPSGEDFSASSGQVISQQAVGSGSHVMEEDDVEYDTAGNIQAGGDQGLTAIALYDYQAADDSEITFDPDDIITNIEQIDDGWWTGTAPDGSNGMFPANYVEIQKTN